MKKNEMILSMMTKIMGMAISQPEYYHVFKNSKSEEVEFFLLHKNNTIFIRANMKSQKGHNQWFSIDEYEDFLKFFLIDEKVFISYLYSNLESSYVYFMTEIDSLQQSLGKDRCDKAISSHKSFLGELKKAILKFGSKKPVLSIVSN